MMDENVVNELIDAIIVLKNHLGPNGEFSICKSDGGKINLFEALSLVLQWIKSVKPLSILDHWQLSKRAAG